MMEIQIRDEALGSEVKSGFKLPVPSWTMTARELIKMRVEESVRLAALEPAVDAFDFTNDPLGARKPKSSAAPSNPAPYIAAALEAFDKNGFVMLVDDRQVQTLEEKVELKPASEVTFVRLVPLVGG